MDSNNLLDVTLKRNVCIDGLSEDSIRELVDALLVSPTKDFESVVLATAGASVKFVFGPDGNFEGVTAKIDGKDITLIPGVGKGELQIRKGKPTPTYPGPGWKVDPALTQSLLNQPIAEADWEAFIVERVGIINVLPT